MNEKYFCRTCKGDRNHKELFKEETRGSDDDGFYQWIEHFCVIQCLGCETISFLKIYGDTEMVDHNYDGNGNVNYYFNKDIFPYYLLKGDELSYQHYLPPHIKDIYGETILALKAGAYILAAGGMRALIDALGNHLKIRKDELSIRIDLLYKKGHLTLNESKRLHSIRFLGNDALHEIEKPKKEQLFLLLEIVNHLLANLFINDSKLKGSLETLVDNYEEFLRLIRTKINKEQLDKELTLLQILNKSKRQLSKEKILEYETKLIEELKDNRHDGYLELVSEEPNIVYRIKKVPSAYQFEL